ncbi:hypothetical protein [Kineococcus gypseus]|uniref:hypothetical protein n=1 Tax=Kineococcus gypseus TaxID=1637102 RepID=UPI003D7E74AE
MGWARLDDRWHDHPKVIAAGLEAAGLWTMALTWAHSDHQRARANGAPLGVVPDGVLARFAGARAKKLAATLHAVGLFDERTDAGWPIHDYVRYLPKYDPEKARENGAKGGKAKAERQAEAQQSATEPPSEPLADRQETGKRNVATRASVRRNPDPEPDPEPGSGDLGGSLTKPTRELAPPPRCPEHLTRPATGACGPCGDARRAREAHDRDEAQRRRDAGPVIGVDCPEHPGQPAGRCGPCTAQAAPPPPNWRAAS